MTNTVLHPQAREVAMAPGISKPTFWRHIGNGTLPNPVRLVASPHRPQPEIPEITESALPNTP